MEAGYHYQNEGLSLAKAASQAGVSWARMREILVEKGMTPQLGPESIEEAAGEVSALRGFLAARPCVEENQGKSDAESRLGMSSQ